MIDNRLMRVLLLFLAVSLANSATAAVWDEASNGDISGDRAAPTTAAVALGDNVVKGATGRNDLDYLTITVPDGLTLDSIVLDDYTSLDQKGFMALQAGSVFTEPPGASEVKVENLLGYVLFGSGDAAKGHDLLPVMAAADGVIGFTTPLPAGPYTFWIQQTGLATTYAMNFRVTPEPSALVLASVAGVAICGARLLRRGRRTVVNSPTP
jgi:hypothetical protein